MHLLFHQIVYECFFCATLILAVLKGKVSKNRWTLWVNSLHLMSLIYDYIWSLNEQFKRKIFYHKYLNAKVFVEYFCFCLPQFSVFSFEEWPSRNLLCNSFCLANIDVCKVKNKGIVELKHLLREADCCLICACLLCSEKLTFKLKKQIILIHRSHPWYLLAECHCRF